MQVIAADVPSSRSDRIRVIRSAATATLLLLAGAMLAWLCIGTPLVNQFIPDGRPSAMQVAMGVVAWGFAILVPAGFLIIGFARMAGVIDALAAFRPTGVSVGLGKELGADHVVATSLQLPGGRRVHELVLGPFGIVVIAEVPPPAVSRHVGNRWELRGERGRWIPIESPVDRATRDAERVRGWLATYDRDFLVRVYAAVVTDDTRVERTPACAVVRPADLAAWLEALPGQRGLTPERRGRVTDLIRSIALRTP